jgi:hypothetical protein
MRRRFLLCDVKQGEELMTHFRQASIFAATAVSLIACVTAVNAQTTVITREPVQTETVVTTTQPLQLTPVQRQTIYRTIVQRPVTRAQPTVSYRVGMRVPETAQLYDVPDTVAVEVPAVRSYKYMMVNDRVVLVDPATSEVVGELAD